MSRVDATIPPAEHDLLCEGCGYTLSGLPDDSNCPECGKPIAESTGVGRREPPAWETATRARAGAFFTTSAHVLFRPTHFYRTLATRRDARRARTFAHIHWAVVSVLFGVAASVHLFLFLRAYPIAQVPIPFLVEMALVTVLLAAAAYLSIAGTTWLAAALSAWEGAYRGLRLPRPVVLRGLYYHAAHYLPVAIVAVMTVVGFQVLDDTGILPVDAPVKYLYVLCAEVLFAPSISSRPTGPRCGT
jgi:hypothetical protein